MAVVIGYDIGGAICKALGLGNKMVTRLRLDIGMEDAVTVEATMLVNEEGGAGLVEVLKRYELREREDRLESPPLSRSCMSSIIEAEIDAQNLPSGPAPIKFREFL